MHETLHWISYDSKIIEVTVTDLGRVVNDWIQGTVNFYGGIPTVVGLDIKHWKSFTTNKTATLQLCIDNKCLILQLLYMRETSALLYDFLMNPNFIFVGVEVESGMRKLRAEYGVGSDYNSVDIRELASQRWPEKFNGWRVVGLTELAMEVCGLYMEKPIEVTLSYWEKRDLSREQVEYACIDAYASYKIGHKLLAENQISSLLYNFLN